MDFNLDAVMPVLVRKAADTNAFIAEEAEKALYSGCQYCTASKVLSSVFTVNSRANNIKLKKVVAVNAIIENLDTKVKTFKDTERMTKFLASMLNEAAVEIRNTAKQGIMLLKN